MTQTLATGELPQSKYAGLPGAHAYQTVVAPEHLLGMIAGPPGEGKSTFIQSNPDGYVINLDGATTGAGARGQVWPILNKEGQPVDETSTPVVLVWEKMQEVVDILCTLSREQQPRPKTVYIDSLGAFTRLAIDYFMRQREDPTPFTSLDARHAWPPIYDLCIETIEKLKRYGYGVYLTCHIINTVVPIGEDRYEERLELTMTDGFYKRLYWMFEMVMAVTCDYKTKKREVPQAERTNPKTKKKFTPKPKVVTEKTTVYTLTCEGEKTSGITKDRVPVPDIELPRFNGWQVFHDAYMQAAQDEAQAATAAESEVNP